MLFSVTADKSRKVLPVISILKLVKIYKSEAPKMRYKLVIDLLVDDENTGKVKRSFRTSMYLDSYDGSSDNYLRQSLISACKGTSNIIEEM